MNKGSIYINGKRMTRRFIRSGFNPSNRGVGIPEIASSTPYLRGHEHFTSKITKISDIATLLDGARLIFLVNNIGIGIDISIKTNARILVTKICSFPNTVEIHPPSQTLRVRISMGCMVPLIDMNIARRGGMQRLAPAR